MPRELELPGCAAQVRRMPFARGRAQGRTRQEVRGLPFAERLAAMGLRPRKRRSFPAAGCTRQIAVRRLPSRTAGYAQDAETMRGLPSQGRPAFGSVRLAVRPLPHGRLLEGRARSIGKPT